MNDSFVFNEQTMPLGKNYWIRLHSGWSTVGAIESVDKGVIRVVLPSVMIGNVYLGELENEIPVGDIAIIESIKGGGFRLQNEIVA